MTRISTCRCIIISSFISKGSSSWSLILWRQVSHFEQISNSKNAHGLYETEHFALICTCMCNLVQSADLYFISSIERRRNQLSLTFGYISVQLTPIYGTAGSTRTRLFLFSIKTLIFLEICFLLPLTTDLHPSNVV